MIKVSDDIILYSLSQKYASCIFKTLDREREYIRVWLPFVESIHEISDIEKEIDYMVDEINEQFCIYYHDKFVGLVGFKDTESNNKKTEIGYWLSQYAQGNGIVTQSVKCLLNYAFTEKEINRVQIKVAIENKKSRSIPERLGLRQEGIEHDGELLVDNKYTDIVVYSLLKREFKG